MLMPRITSICKFEKTVSITPIRKRRWDMQRQELEARISHCALLSIVKCRSFNDQAPEEKGKANET